MLRKAIIVAIFGSFHAATAITVQPRWGHTATLIGNSLYVYGGKSGQQGTIQTAPNTNDLLMLNINQAFSVSSPPFSQGWEGAVGPTVSWHSANVGGPNNTYLFIFGGDQSGPSSDADSCWYYDTLAFAWFNPKSMTGEPTRRMEQTAVTRISDGTSYIFGGIADSSQVPPPQYNDIYRFDSINNAWTLLDPSDTNAPSARYHHTATLIGNSIYVIGGYAQSNGMVPLTDIYIFNISNGLWSKQTAGGITPQSRRDHSAVATNDGKIIVYGGVSGDFSTYMSDTLILDTTMVPPTWSTAAISDGTSSSPKARYAHTATMVGTNMIVAFGYTSENIGDNSLYVLDTTKMAWTNMYTPNHLEYTSTKNGIVAGSSSSNSGNTSGNSSSTGSQQSSSNSSSSTHSDGSVGGSSGSTSSPDSPSKGKTGVIVGSLLGILGFFGACALIFVTYRRRQRDGAAGQWHRKSMYNFDGDDGGHDPSVPPPPVTNLAFSPPQQQRGVEREMQDVVAYNAAIYSPLLTRAIHDQENNSNNNSSQQLPSRLSRDFSPEQNYTLPPIVPNFSLSSPSSWDPPDLNMRRESLKSSNATMAGAMSGPTYTPVATRLEDIPERNFTKSPALSTVPTISPVQPSTAIMTPEPDNDIEGRQFVSLPVASGWAVNRQFSIDRNGQFSEKSPAMLPISTDNDIQTRQKHMAQDSDSIDETYRNIEVQRTNTIVLPSRQLYIVNPDNASN